MIDDKILLHKELAGSLKSEILIHSDSLRTILVFGIFLPETKKVAPPSTELRTSSIISAICTFDAKKVLEYRFMILISLFGTVS